MNGHYICEDCAENFTQQDDNSWTVLDEIRKDKDLNNDLFIIHKDCLKPTDTIIQEYKGLYLVRADPNA